MSGGVSTTGPTSSSHSIAVSFFEAALKIKDRKGLVGSICPTRFVSKEEVEDDLEDSSSGGGLSKAESGCTVS